MSEARSEQVVSHYPGLPAPVPLRLVTSPDHPCSYFPDRRATSRAFWADQIPPDLYHRFMDAGYRRSGKVIYQNVCAGCRLCVPIRVPVAAFTPDKSQRRCWRRNQDLTVTVNLPDASDEKFDLYSRYRDRWHGATEPADRDGFVSFLYDSPAETAEVCYRDAAGKLLGVGICDLCDESLSTVYFYFDPDESKRGLGTFSALWEIEWARRAGIPYYYLGFWVAGCGAMSYKANFKPYELLGTDGVWRAG